MSRETTEWLNRNTLIGFGHQAWHFDAAAQGDEANHYPGAIPPADVTRRLFGWQAVAATLTATLPDGTVVPVPDRLATVHGGTGEVFGVFSDGYALHQHGELLAGLENIIDGTLGISSAVLLAGGAVAAVSVSLADTVCTPEGVEFLPYLMAYGSHNGKYATGFKRVVTNVVCDNTMGTAVGEKAAVAYKIRHTRNSMLKVRDAQQALGLIMAGAEEFSAQVKALCETTVTDAEWFAFLDASTPIDPVKGRSQTMAQNKQDELRRLWTRDSRVAPWKGTAYGVVQAVNTYAHHFQIVRGAGRAERNVLSTLSGDFDSLDAGTLEVLGKVLARV